MRCGPEGRGPGGSTWLGPSAVVGAPVTLTISASDDGRAVLFSSHVMQEVSALCDTIVVIARGHIVAAGSPDDLRAKTGQDNLEDAFVALSGLEAEASPS